MPRRRLRSDEWFGYCGRCDDDAVLTVVKAGGRWTLRQLFGRSWSESDFDVTCRGCGSCWPAHIHGRALSLEDWWEQTRGASQTDG